MNRIQILSCLSLLLGTLGCEEDVESTDIRTSGVYPVIRVTADGSGKSEVWVRLKVGGESSNTYLDLKGEDKLTASADGVSRELDETDDQTYTATFDIDEEDTEFTVAFTRGSIDVDAPESKVSLPAPFELALAVTEASRATDSVGVSWDPPAASGNIGWDLAGDCIKSDDGSTPDDGELELPAIETFSSDAAKTCTVHLGLTRSRGGSVDSHFSEGGDITARHVRGGSFTSSP